MTTPIPDSVERAESRRLFARARVLFPGGVNSPVRAFRGVGGEPVFIASASGARITDEDGRTYLDYIGSWGPMILGHSHPAIVGAIREQAGRGTSFGAPTRLEIELADAVMAAVPSVERLRLVNSGTEATMAAVRVARGATGRSAIVKFEGCYHGHADTFLIKAGSGAATMGVPDSAGVPAATAATTLTASFNDVGSVERCFDAAPGGVAAVIVEPVVGNMGVVAPATGFLEGLRELTTARGAVLIFDEVMTGFRVAHGGAQQRYGVQPDLTTFGKIIGGGLPVGAYGGRRDLMALVAPEGPVYQAGTLSGNPLAMAAGRAALAAIAGDSSIYTRLEGLGAALEAALAEVIARRGFPCGVARVGSMWTLFFRQEPVRNWADASACDTARFAVFFHEMLRRGVMLAPSQFEANFISAAHTGADIAETAASAAAALESACA
ncbi:MAG: glutamate-1-semialdehyde 2,1-aminomutase [Vicinamibacterales bacterium]